MKLIKTIQVGVLLIPLLLFFNSFAGDDCVDCENKLQNFKSNNLSNFMSSTTRALASRKIDNDMDVCGAVESGNASGLEAALRERFNLSLEEGYLDIWCGETDLMGTIIDSPHERYYVAKYIRRYFTKMEKPERFSELLLSEVNGIEVLRRIESVIERVEGVEELKGGEMHTRLLRMQKKYTAWLKKYPVAP